MDVSIIVDNLISNARKARASRIKFELKPLDKTGLESRVSTGGSGLARGADEKRIFEMGIRPPVDQGLAFTMCGRCLVIGGRSNLKIGERRGLRYQAGETEEREMRIDFNVLWVDDQPKAVESQIAAIAREMADEGNSLQLKTVPQH